MISTINNSLARRRAQLAENDQKGFTLVELLVVVLIIGILAAIAIPFFLNQRQSAWEGQVTSDIKNAVTAAETFGSKNNGKFTGLTYVAPASAGAAPSGTLYDNGYRPTEGVVLTVAVTNPAGGVTGQSYTITAYNSNIGSTPTWTYNSATGKTDKNTTAAPAGD